MSTPANQTSSSNSVNPSTLTSTDPVNWPTVPIVDVLVVTPGTMASIAFTELRNCKARMRGRAIGQIVGPIEVSIWASANHSVVAVAGVVPSDAGDTNKPSSVHELILCHGVILRSNPTAGTQTANLEFPPGVTTTLKGATTTVLTGAPPHLYCSATSITTNDGKTSNGAVYLRISYRLALDGYDWLKPF